MSNQTEIKVTLPDKLIKWFDEYSAITKKSLNEVIEANLNEFIKENDDLLCVEWSTLSDKFDLDYETEMDARQTYIDVVNSADESQTNEEIMENLKASFKSQGLNHSEEFIRFIYLDLLFT